MTKAVASSELEVSELTKELEKAKASGMDETDAEGYRELVLALSEATVEAQQYNAELREINQELNFDHGSADVLVEKQRLLTKALAEAEAQASELSEALEQAREAGLDSEDAEGYQELSEALEQAQQQARQYADELENLSENTDECTDDTDSLSESLAGSVLAGQLAAESFGFLMEKIGELVQWVLNLNEATEEYRVAQAKLNTAFEAAGYSADVANQAFSSFYGMVYAQATRWAGLGGTTIEDLTQAGFIAVLRAVDSYDPSRGTKFSTHLFQRLRAEHDTLFDSYGSYIKQTRFGPDELKRVRFYPSVG